MTLISETVSLILLEMLILSEFWKQSKQHM